MENRTELERLIDSKIKTKKEKNWKRQNEHKKEWRQMQ